MTSVDTIRRALEMSHDWSRGLAEDMRDAAMTAPTPNGGNHPGWVIGHAAHARGALLGMITGEPNPLAEWDAVLGGGSEPCDDAAAYPAFDELLKAYGQMHQQTMAYLETLNEATLNRALAAPWPDFQDEPHFQTVGRILLFIAMHEMSHRGQLADARRAAGRKPLFF